MRPTPRPALFPCQKLRISQAFLLAKSGKQGILDSCRIYLDSIFLKCATIFKGKRLEQQYTSFGLLLHYTRSKRATRFAAMLCCAMQSCECASLQQKTFQDPTYSFDFLGPEPKNHIWKTSFKWAVSMPSGSGTDQTQCALRFVL